MIIKPVKRVYLALESWFNLSFGTDWNPLYHLGTLSFFLFWVILVTGIYLFIPFHGSLEGLTVLHQPIGQADAHGFFGIHRPSGKNQIERPAVADQSRKADGTAVNQRHTPAAAVNAHHGAAFNNPQVTPQGQLEATGNCVADRKSVV